MWDIEGIFGKGEAKILKSVKELLLTNNESSAYFKIILACFIWGSYGLFIRIIDYPPVLIVFFRFFIAALILLFFAGLTGKLSQLKTSKWKLLVPISIINTVSWLTLTYSVALTGVATGFVLLYTAPCFVVLLSPFFLKEKIEKTAVVALILSFTGIISIMGLSNITRGVDVWQGNLMGLASGLTYALYIMGLKHLPSNVLGLVSNIYLCSTIAIMTLPLAIRHLHLISLSDFLLLLVMSIFIQVIATTLYMLGLRKVKAQHASILCYSEALFAILLAAIFLKESITLNLIAGTALIVGGGLILINKSKNSHTAAN